MHRYFNELIGSCESDFNYTASISRWLQDKIEKSTGLLKYITDVLSMDPDDVEEYIDGLPVSVQNAQLPYFPDANDQAGQIYTLKQVCEGLHEQEGSISFQRANEVSSQLSGSIAAMEATVIGINGLTETGSIDRSDYLAAIELNLGALSDQMLSIVGAVGDILSDKMTPIRDKVLNLLRAVGVYDAEYDGFGSMDCLLTEYTGLTGLTALATLLADTVSTVASMVYNISSIITSFLSSVFQNMLGDGLAALNSMHQVVTGSSDAIEVREKDFTDWTIDNCDFCAKMPVSDWENKYILSKLDTHTAMHLLFKFGSIDLWLSADRQWVNMTLHWSAIDCDAFLDGYSGWGQLSSEQRGLYIFDLFGILSTSRWQSYIGDYTWASDYNQQHVLGEMAGKLVEAESPQEVTAVFRDIASAWQNHPSVRMDMARNASDDYMMAGLICNQWLTFLCLGYMYSPDGFSPTDVNANLYDWHNRRLFVNPWIADGPRYIEGTMKRFPYELIPVDDPNVEDYVLVPNNAYSKTDFTPERYPLHRVGFLREMTNRDFLYQGQLMPITYATSLLGPVTLHRNEIHDFLSQIFFGLLDDVSEALEAYHNAPYDHLPDVFVPYFYVTSFATGKWHIRTDSQIMAIVKTYLAIITVSFAAVLTFIALTTVKRKLWTAQASLDFQAFELDVGKNGRVASKLYKRQRLIDRANALLDAITGSVKGATSRLFQGTSNLINSTVGRVQSVVRTGDQEFDSDTENDDDYTTEHIVNLIKPKNTL